jgi:RNA polymerase sigma factor (TIGR02999 family)
MDPDRHQLTLLLHRAAAGDRQAASELLPLVYGELRRLARDRLRKLPPGQTLQATALVHEAYLRVVDRPEEDWEGRRHFFFVAARAMRDILVEDARRKSALRRGGDQVRIELADGALEVAAPADRVLTLDLGLQRLEAADPEGYELVMLRFFTGLTLPEIADAWGRSLRTVERKWRFVRSWLAREMEAGT